LCFSAKIGTLLPNKKPEAPMDDKMKMARFPGTPSFGMAVVDGGRISPRELMRRKLMRKMIARRLRNAEMASAK
jgi:hypothetical protein